MTSRPYSWEQLRRLSLARQLPRIRGRGVAAVTEVVERVGPMQTQTARSAFLGLAARLPGVTHATITDAYEQYRIVRGSTIRGTVHTSTPSQHALLERATRIGQRAIWARTLGLREVTLDQVWAGIEEFATPSWREVDDLREHLRTWLSEHGEEPSAELGSTLGRSLSFGHGGLIRRPLAGGWEAQGRPGYRWVAAALDEASAPDRAAHAASRAAPHAEAMAAVVLLHLRSHGPATRSDIAWWSGLGLREVDGALSALADRLTERPGPDGQRYWDVADGVPAGVGDVGTRLLPEFDALLCGYHPKARDRFITAQQHAILWNQKNGLLLAPLLHQGRLAGSWRLSGTGRTRRLQLTCFDGVVRPNEADVAPAADAVGSALDLTIGEIEIG